MQWTVQYFIYHSQWWQSASPSENTLPGLLAYANCQQALQHKLALRADNAFRFNKCQLYLPSMNENVLVLCKHNYLDHHPQSLCQIKTFSIFNPFSWNLWLKGPLQMRTQEIIWYAESQFHQVLLQVNQANFIKQPMDCKKFSILSL